uniref:Tyrosyl-DNA phosphodiesterase 1-like n=1 Tax=Dermatophagoides pteronyssinus TaxID=6956 RepID=A0A6P6Y9B6_DERPT|nr:tyrosyl-DNA phosphodiesterase 1-like [Dermatophagoides pteronyssinus]
MLSNSFFSIMTTEINKKPICPYGNECYRKNPLHLNEFSHPSSNKRQLNNDGDNQAITNKHKKRSTIDDVIHECYGFFLNYLPDRLNNRLSNRYKTISLKAILSNENGKILESIHFNYIYDLEWLIAQYPINCQMNPIDIVFGDRNDDNFVDLLKIESLSYSNVKLCPVKMGGIFSCHHSKMIILRYEDSIRIIILTANMIPMDFYAVTQGIWISQKLPKKSNKEEEENQTSKTNFKNDLIQYLTHYKKTTVDKWIQIIGDYDFSSINVFLIASVPDSHQNNDRESFGHLKIRKIFKTNRFGPTEETNNWPIICQFSSIGSLGPTKESWLTGQFSASLSSLYNDFSGIKPEIKCIYPSIENIKNSIEDTGSSFPYRKSTADKQLYLNDFCHKWKATINNRNDVMPHIKTYLRLSPDNKEMSWFCLTSANLSKAAWGQLIGNGSKLKILNYELGVLFLPKLMINRNSFSIDSQNNNPYSFPLPYDLPLVKYDKNDKPWVNN